MIDYDKKIVKQFKDTIAISKFKEELIMKKIMKKQVMVIAVIGIIFLTGSFATVNAATDGTLVNNIKEFLFKEAQSKIEAEIKEDTFEIEGYETDEEENVTSSVYTFEDEDGYTYKILDVKE